jgi:hypothetical protein
MLRAVLALLSSRQVGARIQLRLCECVSHATQLEYEKGADHHADAPLLESLWEDHHASAEEADCWRQPTVTALRDRRLML